MLIGDKIYIRKTSLSIIINVTPFEKYITIGLHNVFNIKRVLFIDKRYLNHREQ